MDATLQDLPLFTALATDPNVDTLKHLLRAHGHLSRAQLTQMTGWTERDVRALAEAAGSDIVRGQHGFALFDPLFDAGGADEINRAAEASISQGKKQIRYGMALKRRLHQRIA